MIILYNPPSSANRKPVLPMSLLALGAVLGEEHNYTIVDGNLEADPTSALDRAIRETGARLLGVTVMPGPQLGSAVPLCRRLKAEHPELTIVWGGYFPTQHYEVCLRSEYVDYVVRGHGEIAFKRLADALAAGHDPGGVPGLAYRLKSSGEIVTTGRASVPQPEELPNWPYHHLDMERYVRPTYMGQRTLAHHSSYGCPFSCNFCAVCNMAGGRWAAQSASRTAQVVHRLVREWGADAVEFYDNNFFVSEARTAEFARQIADLGIHWWGEGRIDTLMGYGEQTWELMRSSGLKMVFLGAESGSDETLRRMNKGGKAATCQTLEIARKMARYGIVPEMSFMLGNPPDPESDARETIAFIRQVKRVNPATEIILYLNTPVPMADATRAGEQPRETGFKFPGSLAEWISPEWTEFSLRRNPHTPWLHDPLRRQIRDFQQVLNAYYPTITDMKLRGARRMIPRALASWRYRLGWYRFPLELRLLNKVFAYQRPETSGF